MARNMSAARADAGHVPHLVTELILDIARDGKEGQPLGEGHQQRPGTPPDVHRVASRVRQDFGGEHNTANGLSCHMYSGLT